MRRSFPILLTALLCAVGTPVFAQLREYVCTVSPIYADTTLAYATETADSLAKAGYGDAAKLLRELSKAGFGSGFVYVAKSGKNYIVTNRHVVVDADSADIEFEAASGGKTKYAACPVVAVDDELDLALLAFPNDQRPFAEGLAFGGTPLSDGQEVWSAGYPGLGGKPSWQLGKGTVTNGSAKIDELVDAALSSLIQHSAQVDPGNSGGPLLVADAGAKSGYAVVGVNTWKARFRQAANFALPAKTVSTFIDAATAERTPAVAKERLQTRYGALVSAFGADEDRYRKIARYVGFSYVRQYGETAFKAALASAPTDVRSDITGTFVDAPIEGMRLAIGYALEKRLTETKQSIAAKDGLSVSGDTGKTPFALGPEDYEIAWREEYRSWRVELFPELKKAEEKAADAKKKKKAKKSTATFAIETPYEGMVAAELSFIGDDLKLFSLNFLGIKNDFVGFGASLGIAKSNRDSYTDEFGYTEDGTSGTIIRVGGLGRLQLPIALDTISFIPYVDGSAGVQIDSGDAFGSGIFFRGAGGLQVCVDYGVKWLVGVAYGNDVMPGTELPDGTKTGTDESAFSIWLGIGF